MRLIFYFILIILFLSGCTTEPEKPIETDELLANAGSDGECQIGDVYVLDGSGSSYPKDKYLEWKWWQDPTNPEKVILLNGYISVATTFRKPGLYKFRLTIIDGTEESKPDEVEVRVNYKDSRFEDPHLEAAIRYKLGHNSGELSEELCLSVDSLISPWFTEITDLKGIGTCTNLEWLNMSRQKITSLTPLLNLNNLKFLSIDQNYNITDVSPLVHLTDLEYLDISDNNVSDISILAGLSKLTFFGAQFNYGITDISVIANFIDLERVYFSNSHFEDMSAVTHLTKLERLFMSKCGINDINPVTNLTNLKLLYLNWNNIEDINPLQNLTGLERLYLWDNKVQNIEVCESMVNLHLLNLRSNSIVDIEPLVKNTGLGEGDLVDLQENPLSDKSVEEYIPILKDRGVIVEFSPPKENPDL